MARKVHTYSPQTRDAVRVLGLELARARRARRWTTHDLAERAGISINTLRAAERGTPTVAIGIMFELATILGLDLLGVTPDRLSDLVARGRERLAVLPGSVREPTGPIDDDF